jgi:integrase
MGFTRDRWITKVRRPDGRVVTKRTAKYGRGKRWLSVWHDDSGRERSRAFTSKADAERNWQAMELDVARGEYIDPKAGRELVRAVGKRWLASRSVDPASMIRYEGLWRLHVEPEFGRRQVKVVKASEVQAWLARLAEQYDAATCAGAYLVLQGVFELAIADGLLKDNPARSIAVTKPRTGTGRKITAWTDDQAGAVMDAHPDHLRLIPALMAGCGLRIAEALAVAREDFDFDDRILHVRRQLKSLAPHYIFAKPKNDLERDVPLPDWVGTLTLAHISRYPPRPLTLPWEKLTGNPKLVTCSILVRWANGDHVHYRLYSEQVWKPALVKAGIIPEPGKDRRGRRRYQTTRKEGPHQLRHYYSSIMLAGGVPISDLAEYLGHHDPSVTLRLYGHMQPGAGDRAREVIDRRLFRPRAVASGPAAPGAPSSG